MPNELHRAAGMTYDLLPYFYGGDGKAWQCGAEQMRIHRQDGDGDNWVQFLLSKNLNAEQFHISHGWIFRGMDTSPDLSTYYMTYTLADGGFEPGHAWFPRFASAGSWFVTNGWTQFYWKGPFVSAEGTSTGDTHAAGTAKSHKYYDPWKVKFEAHHQVWAPTGHNLRSHVAHFRSYKEMDGRFVPQEDYAFQRGYGMIGWQKYEGEQPRGWSWIDNEKSEPRQLYPPPNGWPKLDGKSLLGTLPKVDSPIPTPEPAPVPEPTPAADVMPLYGIKRDILTLSIDANDLNPDKGLSVDQTKQVLIDGGSTAAMFIESIPHAIDTYKRMARYTPDPFVCVRLYNVFNDSEKNFDARVWLNHSVDEMEAWIVKNVQRPGGQLYAYRDDIGKLWLQLSYNESHFAIGNTDKNHPESLYKLLQWTLGLAKVAVRLKQRLSIGAFAAAKTIQNGMDEIAMGWWDELLTFLVGETDGVPHSEYVIIDFHEYTCYHLMSAYVEDQRAAILQAANGTGPLVDPDNWPTELLPADKLFHMQRVERLQVQCEKLTGKRFKFSESERGWDLMDDVQETDFNDPKWAYLKQYTPDYDQMMAGAIRHTIREYTYRKTGDPLFGEQRGPLTLRRYNARTLGKMSISDEDSAAWQFKQAVQDASLAPKECVMLAHFGANNDWFNDADGEKCEGKGFDWARPMGRQFMVLLATSKAHTYEEIQALRAGQTEDDDQPMENDANMKHVRVQSKAAAGSSTLIRSEPKVSTPRFANVVGKLLGGQRYEAYLNYTDTVEANGETWGRIRVQSAEGYVALDWISWGTFEDTQEVPAVTPPEDDQPPEEPPTEPPDEQPENGEESPPDSPGDAPVDDEDETPTDEPETPENGADDDPTPPPPGMAEIRLDKIDPVHLPAIAEINMGLVLAALGIPAYIYTVGDALKMIKTAAAYAEAEAERERLKAEAVDPVFGNGAKADD